MSDSDREEKSIEEQTLIKAQEVRKTARYMASFEDLVEERIRKAREKGDFDNLEGQGKPINLYENPYEPDDMRVCNKMLKDAGYAPYWIEIGKDVDASIVKFWEDVDRFRRVLSVKKKNEKSDRMRTLKEIRVKKYLAGAESDLRAINKKIDSFNNNCPLWWLSRERLNVNREMEKVRQRLFAPEESP